jgi:NAD(P)-dependent dehydrogenase (short-subunit alcohol dehydrogenase family)
VWRWSQAARVASAPPSRADWRVAARRSPLGTRRIARGGELRDTILNGGAGASVHQGNVGDPDDCRRVVGEVIERHGRLDILVNNAGVTVDRPVLSMTVDDWHKVLRVNLSGAFYISKPALEHMKCLRQRCRGQCGLRGSRGAVTPFSARSTGAESAVQLLA